jgi:hypothetical protein
MQDKYFFVFAASNPRGKLLEEGGSGQNMWLTYDEIASSGLAIQGGLEILQMVDDQTLSFDESMFQITDY